MPPAEIPKYIDNIPASDKIKRFIWQIVSFLLFRPFALPIFHKWRIFLLRCFGAVIGKGCIVHASAYIPAPWNLIIGEKTAIGPEVKLHIGKTILGNKVTISQRSYLCSATHEINSINTPFAAGTIIVKDFAWVAAEAFIMSNITIGEGAIVGARAAVFKNVEPWTVVGGNPAKFIKKREVYDY
ncbi:MAG: hypothetical protein PW786_01300 [Arachidicoccus sp.]|nr:hypothetical protein [Arachidicoccus sp.]